MPAWLQQSHACHSPGCCCVPLAASTSSKCSLEIKLQTTSNHQPRSLQISLQFHGLETHYLPQQDEKTAPHLKYLAVEIHFSLDENKQGEMTSTSPTRVSMAISHQAPLAWRRHAGKLYSHWFCSTIKDSQLLLPQIIQPLLSFQKIAIIPSCKAVSSASKHWTYSLKKNQQKLRWI